MALITCSECGKQVSDKVKQCIHCGAEAVQLQSCPECGQRVLSKAVSCPKCGIKLIEKQVADEKKAFAIEQSKGKWIAHLFGFILGSLFLLFACCFLL